MPAEIALKTFSFAVGCLSGVGFMMLIGIIAYMYVKTRSVFRRRQ